MASSKTLFIVAIMVAMLPIKLKAQVNGSITLKFPNTSGTYKSNRSIILSPGFTSSAPFLAKIEAKDCIPLTTAPTLTENYIITSVPRISGIKNESGLANRGTCELQQSIQYIDGLGRPLQNIQVMSSPFGYDLVQPIAYDQYGREVKQYLPYVPSDSIAGLYRPDALSQQKVFYKAQNDITGVVQIPDGEVAYAETQLENSPLSRPLQQGAPGLNNQIDGGHTATTTYSVNTVTDAVRMWQVNDINGASYSSIYPAGTLVKTIATDENQNNNSVIQFKNKDGHTVSRWVQNGPGVYYVTDYIYDDLGRLSYVIPPLPQIAGPAGNSAAVLPTSFVETDKVFLDFFYGYHYDGLDRLTEKKIPGQGWQFTIYNEMDQAILTQDANQKNKNLWMVTKYDALGRVVQTGEYYSANGTRASLQIAANGNATNLYETFTNSPTNFGYSHATYPDISSGNNNKILISHYFDNYDVIANPSINPGANVFKTPDAALDSLEQQPTGTQVAILANVLNTPTYLFSVMHYDKDGRPVKVISQHYQGGSAAYDKFDSEESSYSFQSLPLQQIRKHYVSSNLQVTINNWMTYDHSNRLLLKKQQYNSNDITTLSKVEYNELGQPITKHLGSVSAAATPESTTFLQHIDTRYNAKGLLTRINNPGNLVDEKYVTQEDLFAEKLDYDQNTIGYNIVPNYNGNVSSSSWQTKVPQAINMAQEQKGFIYGYDQMGRLTGAYSKAPLSGDGLYNESLTYDELGNILNLQRRSGVGPVLNDIKYSYMNAGTRSNRLISLTDNGSVTESQASAFNYDTNGNLIGDTKKNISNIIYNILNLPQVVNFGTANKSLTYIYDAGGTKLQRIITQNGVVTENRSYVNGIEYSGNSIEFISTSEGRVLPTSTTGPYLYEYALTDHLGNVRAMFGDKNMDNRITSEEILQISDYYAFGREITYNNNVVPSPDNKYKYNGKEYQADLSEYDYGARFYDPIIGRWNVIDPKAEISRAWSTYNYVYNNPISLIDPDGMEATEAETRAAEAHAFFVSTAEQSMEGVAHYSLYNQQDKDKDKKKEEKKTSSVDLKKAFVVGVTTTETAAGEVTVGSVVGGTAQKILGLIAVLFLSGDNETPAVRMARETKHLVDLINAGEIQAFNDAVKDWNSQPKNQGNRIVFRYMSQGEFENIYETVDGKKFALPFSKDGVFQNKYITPDAYTSAGVARSRLALPNRPDLGIFTFESYILPSKSPTGSGVYSRVRPKYGQNGGGREAIIFQPFPVMGGFPLSK